MKSYRVAIVGLGRMGSTIDDEFKGSPSNALPYSIAACCKFSDRLELIAGADTDSEKRDIFGERWGIGALYEDYVEMMEKEKPDMVAVCTRGHLHAEMGVAVAQAGVPMLYLEKAMACSMREADFVRDECIKHGTLFNTGVLRRFDPRYWAVREVIESGQIGEPRVAVHYGRTNLLHGHIHSIDTISYLLGDPKIVSVRGELRFRDKSEPPTIRNNRLDADPDAIFDIVFENGVEAWSVPEGPWEFEVIGDEGAVRSMNNGFNTQLRRAENQGGKRAIWVDAEVPAAEAKSTVVICLEDLLNAHESGNPTLGDVETTHHITEVCLMIAESHRQGGVWMELPLDNRDLYVFHR